MQSVLVVLHRVRGTANAVCPPVGEISPVYRRVLQLGANGGVQFLQGNHFQPHFLAILLVISLDGLQNFRFRGRIIAEHTGHGGDDKIVRIALGFAGSQIRLQILAQGCHGVCGLRAKTILHHKISAAVGLDAQNVA